MSKNNNIHVLSRDVIIDYGSILLLIVLFCNIISRKMYVL
jgi:hypothetical protein